jgi:hypothetical protein
MPVSSLPRENLRYVCDLPDESIPLSKDPDFKAMGYSQHEVYGKHCFADIILEPMTNLIQRTKGKIEDSEQSAEKEKKNLKSLEDALALIKAPATQ